MSAPSKSVAAGPNVEIVREFAAPRERVFQAFETAESLARWFAPNGCTLTVARLEFRAGGTFLTCIRNGDFSCWVLGAYLEIARPERLSFTMTIADEHGVPAAPQAVGHDADWPATTRVDLTFDDLGGRTRLTLRQNVSEALAKRTGAHPSWLQMLDRLAGLLAQA
ncbi:MAG: SRPBCC domain-containing protein [Planctomycetota bacterium]|nr:SRPBCC domain-containing protein [Planctomycetota bacterium]